MPLIVRPTSLSDLPILAEYWYDKMVLCQQYNPSIRLSHNAQTEWQKGAEIWLEKFPQLCFSLSIPTTRFEDTAGAIFGAIQKNQPGLMPIEIGVIQDLVIDLHTRYNHSGLGTQLLHALKHQLMGLQITEVHMTQRAGLVVESAFWKSVSARKYSENYRIKLS